MNASVYVVSIIGLVSSVFTTTINCLLIQRTVKKGSKIHHDFTLFFYRFVLDVTMGSLLGIYLGLTTFYLLFPGNLDMIRQNVGLLGLPSSNAAAARAIVAMLISIERNLATYTPIFYHKLRREFLYISIFIFAIAFGLFEDVVLFLICNVSFRVLPPTCLAFGCAVNSCFRNYWYTWKMVVFAVTFTFSVSLCCKLIYWKHFSSKHSVATISRINRLVLIDATTVLLFDFLPSFCANLWPDALIFSFEELVRNSECLCSTAPFFQYVGPYNAVCKLFGSAIDAILAYKIMLRSPLESTKDHSSSMKPHTMKRANTVDCIL